MIEGDGETLKTSLRPRIKKRGHPNPPCHSRNRLGFHSLRNNSITGISTSGLDTGSSRIIRSSGRSRSSSPRNPSLAAHLSTGWKPGSRWHRASVEHTQPCLRALRGKGVYKARNRDEHTVGFGSASADSQTGLLNSDTPQPRMARS